MADFPNIEPDAEQIGLVANTQIYESPLTRGVQTASLNGSRWMASPTYNNRQGKDARDLRAFIFNQDGAAGRFNYYPFTVDNQGTHAGGGVVDGAGQVGKSLLTKGWDADQSLLFSAGDYLTINGEMKMVTADVAVGQDYIEYDETNYMPSPFDPSGWWGATSDPDGTITNVIMANPSGESFIGLAEQTGAGVFISLSNFPTPISSVTIGEKLYMGMIFKIANFPAKIQTYIAGIGGSGNLTLDLQNKTALTMSANWNYKFTELTDGFFLVETEFVSQASGSNVYQDVILREGLGTIPAVGSQLYVQAAFFGKANDWPAKLRANATIPITPALRVSPSDNNAIEVDNPYFPARLETDDQSKLQVSSNLIYNTTLSIVEDF